jgi:hypothetical protein
MEHTCNTLN